MQTVRKTTYGRLALALATAMLGACGGGNADTPQANQLDPAIIQQEIDARSVALASIDPNHTDFSDLAVFGQSVGDARIVVLNETEHALGENMRLVARLTRYLHEQKGFDVFLMESSLFDVQRMVELKQQQGISYLDSGPGRMFFATSRTAEGRELVRYLDQAAQGGRPLQLAGVDVMMGGESSLTELLPRLEHYLRQNGSTLPDSANWPAYRMVSQKIASLVQVQSDRPSSAEQAAFQQVSTQLASELCQTPYAGEAVFESKSYWCRVTQSLPYQARYLWTSAGSSNADLNWAERDIAQGQNAAWWLEGPFRGKKAILFTHAAHGSVA
ncbi:erythromycin esterase family protein [Chitinilyticum litopenaei]|uniref:erythromycin esterase family protein n=1 Tax=Chitinilyticum litopenaei TaxID=1121276 RepID=UPI0003F9261A|nr:erythromycin esterase family protein [Chitinilyticum litopenaei]